MIAALSVIVLAIVAGLPWATLLDPESRLGARVAQAYLLGVTFIGISLLTASLVGLSWSRLMIVIAVGIWSAVGGAVRRRAGYVGPLGARSERIEYAARGATVLLLTGYAFLATAGPTPEADFVTIWGAKGQQFYLARGVDFGFLGRPEQAFMHPGYPILLPMLFSAVALLAGHWDPIPLGLLYAAFASAVLGIIDGELQREGSRRWAAICVFGLVGVACSPYIGLGEGPLVAFGTAGLLVLRRGAATHQPQVVALGSLLLGGASLVKNEGITFLLAAGIALVLVQRTRASVVSFLPGPVLAVTWIVIRDVHGLSTDLLSDGVFTRLLTHLREPLRYLDLIARYPLGRPLLLLSIALGLIAGARQLRREPFMVIALLVQFCALFSAYLITPHDLDWHFKWSWERVINQLTLPAAFLALVCIRAVLKEQRKQTSSSDSLPV